MDWKIRDAKRVLREKKAKHTKLWREDEKVLRELGVRDRFITIWEKEKSDVKLEMKKKKEKKVEYLINKRRKREQSRHKVVVVFNAFLLPINSAHRAES